MDLEPTSLLKSRLVPLFSNQLSQLTIGEGECEIFGTKGKVYCWIDSYDVPYSYSDAAAVFTVGSLNVIGLNQGTWESPKSAMRFMDYKGAFLLLPVNDEPTELWCSGNYYKKLSPNTPFKTKELADSAAYLELLEDCRAMLVIEVSIRKELYLKNLMVGDEANLVLATETGCVIVPRTGWLEFKEAYLNLPKPKRTESIVVLRGVTTGRLDTSSDRVQKFYSEFMDFAIVAKNTLPKNPQARMIWLAAIGAAA